MKVVVRVRPLLPHENEAKSIIDVMDENVLVFDPKEEVEDFYFQGIKQRDFLKKENKNVNYLFDQVFGPDVANIDVHEKTTKSILDGLFNGYNCSVFAYGATGAGKTFTMLGNDDSPGITFLTMMDLYQHIDAVKAEKSINVAVSYLEIYNENIRDLLNPGKSSLQLREDPKRGTLVMDLSIMKPRNAKEVLQMLEDGNRNRTQHPTDANAESSRSHAVFTVYVSQSDRVASKLANKATGGVRVAKMSLIDLAGSERATMINSNRGARMREGANINKSLLALGNCINALADLKNKPFIPYRNSKLTRLLKDSLGGNCSTVMIAAVSSANRNYEDTYNTLKYADRAKNIRVNLKQNVVNVDMHVGQYAKLVEQLRAEICQLRAQLTEYEKQRTLPPSVVVVAAAPSTSSEETLVAPPSPSATVVTPRIAVVPPSPPISEQLKPQFRDLFSRRFSVQRDLLQTISQANNLELRIERRRQCLEQVALASLTCGQAKGAKSLKTMTARRQALVARAPALSRDIVDNQAQLVCRESELGNNVPEEFSDWLKLQKLELDLLSRKHQVRHLGNLVTDFHKENCRLNGLNVDLLKVCRRQYLLMKSNGLDTCDVVEDYQNVVGQVEGFKAVVWADQNDPYVPPTNISKIAELPKLSLTSAVEGELKVVIGSLNSLVDCTEVQQITLQPGETASNLDGTFCVSPSSSATSQSVDVSYSFVSDNAGRTPPVATKRPIATAASPRSPVPAKREKCVKDCVVEPGSTTKPEATPTTANRRLTFDAPPSSILKICEEGPPGSNELRKMAAPPTPKAKTNSSVVAHKLRDNQMGLRRCISARDLSATRKVGLDLGNIQKLEGLRRQGFPANSGNLPPLAARCINDKDNNLGRFNGPKSVQPKSGPKIHPYKTQPQRIKQFGSCENMNVPPPSKLAAAMSKAASKFTLGKKAKEN